MVIWLTGLSGAGKSTIAMELQKLINKKRQNSFLVDGDEVRKIWGDRLGYSIDERQKGAMRISRLCKWLSEQGADVICATISFFTEVRKWNRANIPGYFEVYIKASLETRVRRDRKSIYSKAFAGELQNVVGLDLILPEPENPDLVINNNDDATSIKSIAEKIIQKVE